MGGGGVLGPGPEPSPLQAPAARLWEVADPTVSTHSSRRAPSPTRTQAPGRARTHTSDIPIVPHVTHGPERATLHTRSRTRTHTRTHKHGLSAPSQLHPRPPAAALQRHSLTVTHLHPFTDTHTPPTHANHRHTFINRARRSTHAPPRLLFRSPESFLPPPRAPHFPV